MNTWIIAAVNLYGFSIVVQATTLDRLYRVLVTSPADRVIRDSGYLYTDALDAAQEGRLTVLTAVGVPLWEVNLWGSHPDEDNDDCHTGQAFEHEAEARAVYDNPSRLFGCSLRYTKYMHLAGPKGDECRLNPSYNPTDDDEDDWRQEQAMQNGMGLGIDAYNDTMGY